MWSGALHPSARTRCGYHAGGRDRAPGSENVEKEGKKTMSEAVTIRKQVSESYARRITESTGCCGAGAGTSSACGTGYGEEIQGLPEGVAESSFGCGNPLAHSELREGDVVLDLGSGAGLDLLIAARKVGPAGRVIGIDMTDEMIARARQNIARAGVSNVEVRKGIIEELPVESGSVDWVISNCVINLSPEKPRVFAEIARVLKPGGRMRVSDIVAEDLPEWIRKDAAAYAACVAGAISEKDYLAGLQAAGLVDVEVTERQVYDAAQIGELARSEIGSASCCGQSTLADAVIDDAAGRMAGKVWSARFAARKP